MTSPENRGRDPNGIRWGHIFRMLFAVGAARLALRLGIVAIVRLVLLALSWHGN